MLEVLSAAEMHAVSPSEDVLVPFPWFRLRRCLDFRRRSLGGLFISAVFIRGLVLRVGRICQCVFGAALGSGSGSSGGGFAFERGH